MSHVNKHFLLSDYSNIADIHAERLQEALKEVRPLMPLSPIILKELSVTQVAFIDMLIMRFGKIQDIIGSKIMALILKALEEEDIAFIDKLNKLEKLGYIPDAHWWISLREMRNQLAHDYPNDLETNCEHISSLVIKADELLQFWKNLKHKITLSIPVTLWI